MRNDKLEMRNGFQMTNKKGQMRNEEGGGNRGERGRKIRNEKGQMRNERDGRTGKEERVEW